MNRTAPPSPALLRYRGAGRYNRTMALQLRFYGGAGKVTGSNFLITGARGKILVDCGVEQGADVSVAEMYGPYP